MVISVLIMAAVMVLRIEKFLKKEPISLALKRKDRFGVSSYA
ncbi:hypothetical protein LDG_6640 [Legionella drancourtii LLAP12]|uniref:Uncharacterized protein n=1 Tax=Legionella drancourtii LLAP12 TaxID=658187 RepID=G9EN20_9GAMM|nr:hypothetical protein LDG_6640 [Legionella drancourtii LLAP12]